MKNQNSSGEIEPWHHKFWLSIEFLTVYMQNSYKQWYYLSTLPRPFTPFTEMEQILLAAIMILHKNTKIKVRSPDGDTDYFDIVVGVLQGDTLTPYLFIICLDYVLRTSIDKIKENGFQADKRKKQKIPRINNYRRRLHRWHSASDKYTA